jgi:hypothetical protein
MVTRLEKMLLVGSLLSVMLLILSPFVYMEAMRSRPLRFDGPIWRGEILVTDSLRPMMRNQPNRLYPFKDRGIIADNYPLNSATWKVRARMMNDVAKNYLKVGMDRGQVLKLLGPPFDFRDEEPPTPQFAYRYKWHGNGTMPYDDLFHCMSVIFDNNGKISRVEISRGS